MPAKQQTRPVPPDAQVVLDQACAIHAACEDQVERMETRRLLWARARELGATQREIAVQCGVSESLVKLEVAKARGASWATG